MKNDGKRSVLIVTFLLAISLHICFIYLLQAMEITSGFAYYQSIDGIGIKELSRYEQRELFKKNEDLAITFKQIIDKPINLDDLSIDYKELSVPNIPYHENRNI